MPFSKHDHVIQAITPDGSNEPLHESPLPWTGRSAEDLLDAHAFDSFAKVIPKDFIPIPKQVTRRRILGKRLHHLLPCPQGGRMLGHVTVNYAPAVMREHHKYE